MLGLFVCLRLFYRKADQKAKWRSAIMLAILVFGLVEIILSWFSAWDSSIWSRELSFAFIVIFIRTIRTTLVEVGHVFAAAGPILLLIAFFILFFAFMGFVLFTDKFDANNEPEAIYFTELGDASLNLFVLFTLSNYPAI
jgi:hypothetical protein